MSAINLSKLNETAAERIKPFLNEILAGYQDMIHSIYVTGTAITDDFDQKRSDVNSIFVLKEMDLKFLELIAPLGKKYGKHKVAAPLIMTPFYIESSLDVFPIEFLNFKLIHQNVFGTDILKDLEISLNDLRHQCEREIKSKLIWLRQGYISSQGDKKLLAEGLADSITGYIPLFRGIIVLLGKEAPVKQSSVIRSLADASGINTDIFAKVLAEKHEKAKHSSEELNAIFKDYYKATEELGRIIDAAIV
ncbi:MAG: hypothetical protein Q7U10_10640 [Thermodesulfovibrionia bacterium]|nr:hypothetical protein [Thermodesulfovibrionia bacterium]